MGTSTVDTLPAETIDTAQLFLDQAAHAGSELRFEDFHELMASFWLETCELERRGIDYDESYWDEHADSFSTLYYLFACAAFLDAIVKIHQAKLLRLPVDPPEDALALIGFHLNQSLWFSRYPGDDMDLYLAYTYQRFSDELDFWINQT